MWYLLNIYLSFLTFSKIDCFNIDTYYPVIYSDPNPDESNRSNTFFGYSVLLFPSKNNDSGSLKIGSPKSSYPSESKSFRPGVVYDCPFREKCEVNERQSWLHNDIRQNMNDSWIGSTMDIGPQYDNWVVSGYRWKYAPIQNKRFRYQFPDYAIGGSEWYNGTTNRSFIITHFNDTDRAIGLDGILSQGMAEAGFSTKIANYDKQPELILGAPGFQNWAGAVLRIRPIAINPPRPSRQIGGLQNVVTLIQKDTTHFRTHNIKTFDYFGYSVTSGYFFGKNKRVFYATGSPRANSYTGKVTVFQESFQRSIYNQYISGLQNGEYFGSAIAAGDLNGDGYDDLVVGAPFHRIQDYNEGKAYIFFGDQVQLVLKFEVKGYMKNSQFGTTIMFIGDINNDNCQDLAIAAPFEDDDRGTIYIYRGGKSRLDVTLSQKIAGKDVFDSLRGFGISISRPADIDNNGYKDIAIGSHLSGHVVVLRSYPIVEIKSALKTLSTALERTDNKVVFQAYFEYSTLSPTSSINISRELFIERGSGILNNLYTANLYLKQGERLIDNITVELNNTRSSGYLQPIVAKLSYQIANVSRTKKVLLISNSNVIKATDDGFCKTCSVVDNVKSRLQVLTTSVPFVQKPGEDTECSSRLEVTWNFPDLRIKKTFTLGSNRSLELKLNITNHGKTTYNPQVQIILPENVDLRQRSMNCYATQKESIIVCNVDNSIETNETKVLTLDLNMDKLNSFSLGADALNFFIKALTCAINVGNNTNESFALELTRDADIYISGESLEQSYPFDKFDNESIIKDHLFSQTIKVGKTGVSSIQSVRINIQVPYAIQTDSTDTIILMKLYKPEGSLGEQSFSCESNFTYISKMEQIDMVSTEDGIQTLKPANTTNNVSRRKRQIIGTETVMKEEAIQLPIQSNSTFYINCSNPEIICSNIICTTGAIEKLQDQAKVDLKMVLDVPKSILLSNKSVVFTTYASVSIINPTEFNQSGQRPDFAEVQSIFIDEGAFGTEPLVAKLAMWILIISVIIGITLLILITLVLFKAGFFKRKTKEQLQLLKEEAEAEAHIIQQMDIDVEPMDMEEMQIPENS